jgi:hypothetical protein
VSRPTFGTLSILRAHVSASANFYEKALFVKTDVAVAPCGRVQLLSALRALCFYSHFQ